MATAQLKKMYSGPISISDPAGTGPINTAASWSLANITNGLPDGYLCYAQVVAALFNYAGGANGSASYSALVTAYVCIGFGASGPTYTLSNVGTSFLHSGSSGTMFDSFTLDQSGGNLRLRITSSTFTAPYVCYAILNTINSK